MEHWWNDVERVKPKKLERTQTYGILWTGSGWKAGTCGDGTNVQFLARNNDYFVSKWEMQSAEISGLQWLAAYTKFYELIS
jgi:hypothetical protein